ncbi:MAG: HNH endonuclease [Gammaproteobacteria bacterium]|nr:HNH endonuclease [Gammaproteobacteria bacterium]MBQ0774491.1 HNH endonuclease [Gammaproteobacteria bacterium]
MARNWTQDELTIALGLYCKLPFGQFHQHQPLIILVAERLDRTPSSIAMKLCNLASLDPVITESGRKGLAGASKLDREVWQAFSEHSSEWMPEIEQRLSQLLDGGKPTTVSVGTEDLPANYRGDNITVTSTRRKGQNLFRDAVFSAYQSRCCVTGVSDSRLLIASHIKPWREDADNRLNPRNGLCLSALVDRAFDLGLVAVSQDYRLMVSPQLGAQRDNVHISETFYSRENKTIELPDKFVPDMAFLEWHRGRVFLQ